MRKISWTPEQDAKLFALRTEGRTWEDIEVELGRKRTVCFERLRGLIALQKSLEPPKPPPAPQPKPINRVGLGSQPLPPGHPVSWNIITAGTSLAGTPYS